MEEKRKFIRITGVKEAAYRVSGGSEGMKKAEVKNLSLVGIHFYASKGMEKGTLIEIQIDSAEHHVSFVVKGVVIWQIASLNDRFATGVRFEHHDDETKNKLSLLISQHADKIEEQREFVRCEILREIFFSYKDNPGQRHSALCVDISKGGMKMMLKERLTGGNRLVVFFSLPDTDKEFECEGKVVWLRDDKDGGFQAGVIFTKVKEEDRDKIWSYIESFCRSTNNEGGK